MNNTIICGQITSDFVFDHESYGEKFLTSEIYVERCSGASDHIQIIISERLLEDMEYKDRYVRLCGQFRSHSKKGHIELYLFVNDMEVLEDVQFANEICFEGYVCKEPTYRTTPFGREITDVLVSVPRSYQKSDFVPCITWGRSARYSSHFNVGDLVEIKGRVQSREYQKNGETHTAYEVSADWISCVNA